MCTYIKKFSARRYIALTASVKFRIVQKRLRMNKFCAPKVIQEVNFQKSFLSSCIEDESVVVHLYCEFSLWRQMAPKRSAKFRTAFLVNFVRV